MTAETAVKTFACRRGGGCGVEPFESVPKRTGHENFQCERKTEDIVPYGETPAKQPAKAEAEAPSAPADEPEPEAELIFGYDPFTAYVVRIPDRRRPAQYDDKTTLEIPEGAVSDFDGERCGVMFNHGEAKFVAMSREASGEVKIERCGKLKEFRSLDYWVYVEGDEPERVEARRGTVGSFDPTSDGAQ